MKYKIIELGYLVPVLFNVDVSQDELFDILKVLEKETERLAIPECVSVYVYNVLKGEYEWL